MYIFINININIRFLHTQWSLGPPREDVGIVLNLAQVVNIFLYMYIMDPEERNLIQHVLPLALLPCLHHHTSLLLLAGQGGHTVRYTLYCTDTNVCEGKRAHLCCEGDISPLGM